MRLLIEIEDACAARLREYGEYPGDRVDIIHATRKRIMEIPENFSDIPPPVLDQIGIERQRQQIIGHTPAHDYTHTESELIDYAAAYALAASKRWNAVTFEEFVPNKWKHPTELSRDEKDGPKARRHLIKAAALLVAEIERLDRAANNAVPA